MKSITKRQVITYSILLLLLVLNVSESTMVLIHDDILNLKTNSGASDQLANWVILLYGLLLFGGFVAIAIVIALNQDDLQRLNMDKSFVVMFLISGLTGLYVLPYNCFAAVAVVFLIYALLSNKLKFETADRSPLINILGFSLLVTSGCLLLVGSSLNIQNMSFFFVEAIPFSVYEEAVYRGMLYMLLKDLNLSESKIFFTQVFVFWISHINYLLSDPLNFWVFIPIIGCTLGYIALRSKSITPSAIAHIFINVLYGFISLSR